MNKLIIIRGNSGSGKTTIAKRLRCEMGYGAMLISQDVVRREILRVKDAAGNPAIRLIGDMVKYGHSIMIRDVMKQLDQTFIYYLDVPFEETLRRHKSKPNAHEFGEKELREWWHEKDVLGADDRIITHEMSEDEITTKIMSGIGQ